MPNSAMTKPSAGLRESGSHAPFGVRACPKPENLSCEGGDMLWLILGVILLVIAIAGGAIVHPVLFALGLLALLLFFVGR
jgi:hypothetical protein